MASCPAGAARRQGILRFFLHRPTEGKEWKE
jgi:hypothetical protein